MKATDLLKKQHNKVKAIFSKLEKGSGDATALLEELASDLAGHMIIEQEIFYPAALAAKESLVLEGFEEHAAAEDALKRLLKTPPDDVTFKAKVTVLKELIEHHVEEEEGELFPAAEKSLGSEELTLLGTKMNALFSEVTGDGAKPAMLRAHKSVGEKGSHKAEARAS
jgi:iron-sulfur cluster repair protein YtfE (RIC family)